MSFSWPCELRRSHKPHDDCPGVRVHPATMIGGRHEEPTNVIPLPKVWECCCGATAPAFSDGWRYTDAAWCPDCAWLA